MKQHLIDWRVAGLIFAAGLTMAAVPGCKGDNGPLGDLAKQCGLVCPDDGIVEGNASISGVASVDAFFGAVVNFSTKASLISSNIDAEMAKIRASLELPETAAAADIKAAIVAKFHLDASASLKVKFQPAKCEVSVKASLEAKAHCEGSVTPPNATVECKGSCEAEASVMAECDAMATAKCVGTAPSLTCSGECSGTCQLDAAATCEGTCKGDCSAGCSATNADGSCNGECTGMCTGTCEMSAKGSCSGQCKGSCEYDPPSGGCEAGASLHCEASGSASVQCSGKCEGEVTPPSAKAECQASAKAEASANVECSPPKLTLEYQFEAGLTAMAQADAQANFEAFLTGFEASFGKIVAELEHGKILVTAGGQLTAAASGAVSGAVNAALDGDVDLKTKVGLGCALTQLEDVGTVIGSSTTKVNASVTAAGNLATAFSG